MTETNRIEFKRELTRELDIEILYFTAFYQGKYNIFHPEKHPEKHPERFHPKEKVQYICGIHKSSDDGTFAGRFDYNTQAYCRNFGDNGR